MKFEPKAVDADVNLPTRHPLVDLAWMAAALLVLLGVLYSVSGVLVDWLARYIPPEYDNRLSGHFDAQLLTEFGPEIRDGELALRTQALFAELREKLPQDDTRTYTLTIIDSPEVNAMALPGAHIVVLNGLLEEAESENEIAMVLAHEFGHVYHRHHWRRLGRAAVVAVAATLTGASQSALQSQVTSAPLATLMQANSRSHESESDRFALDLVCKHYGHYGGATDFFQRHVSDQGSTTKMINFLMAHPLSETRIEQIDQLARESNCPALEVKAWPAPWRAAHGPREFNSQASDNGSNRRRTRVAGAGL